jgi:Glucodextranase, domain B/PASTA domain
VLPLLSACWLAACGEEAERRPVRLEVTSPADAVMVRQDSVEISGRVWPRRARVLVAGRRAPVSAGRFQATVPLRTGANVIDVAGAARGAAPAWTAVRVEREELVVVPDLAGATAGSATRRLETLRLQPETDEQGGLLDRLLGGEPAVCESDPEPGAELPKGSVVRLIVSVTC